MANLATDSLLADLRNTPQNKEKALLFNKLSRTFMKSSIDSSIYFSKKGLELASEIEYPLGIAENAASLADYYVSCDSLNLAKDNYLLAGKYFDELDMDFDQAQLLMILGNIYLSQDNYSEALMYYQKSQNISEENSFTTILTHIYNNMGVIYTDLGENKKALNYLLKAYDGYKTLKLNNNLAHVVSNIAAIYLSESNDSLAKSYYQEALKMYLESNNLVDAAAVYIDLGDNQYDKSNFEKALEYYSEGYKLFVRHDDEYSGPKSRVFVSVIGSLGRVNSKLGNKQKAIEYLEITLDEARQNKYINWIEFSTHELSKIYEKEGEYNKALYYFKIFEQYGDTILNNSSIKRITQLEMQFEFDKKMKEIELENALKEKAQQRKEYIYFLIISVGIFIAVIAILLYINQRSKTNRIELKRKNLKLEHEKLQQELDHRNKELATNVMYLLSKNEFITTTAEKLTKAKMGFKKENQKIIQDVIRDLLLNSSKDVWKEFEVRFQEVHSDFYDNLNKKFPDLTPNEKKICAFLRLNMSTKDISAITYQSVRSIDMARFRLRKKIELDTDENLVSFLSQI